MERLHSGDKRLDLMWERMWKIDQRPYRRPWRWFMLLGVQEKIMVSYGVVFVCVFTWWVTLLVIEAIR